MIYAEKVEFISLPPLVIGETFNGSEVSKIEVYHEEYEGHTELTIIPYDSMCNQLGKYWNMPCAITYKKE